MFASAKVWIVPSLWAEPFGRVSIEAQAAQRAVLVADSGGLPETVGEPSFLMPGYDADEWLERIMTLMQLDTVVLQKNAQKIQDFKIEEALKKTMTLTEGL